MPDCRKERRGGQRAPYATQFEFGPYRLDALRGTLLRGDSLVTLPPRATDVLAILLSHAGQTVAREEFMETVWAGTTVEEGNLSQMISILRKALHRSGDTAYIQTVPRRGYRFARSVKTLDRLVASGNASSDRAAHFVGRTSELRKLDAAFERALAGTGETVFIVGDPGVGKTALVGEFLHRARLRSPELQVCAGNCLEQFGESEAYLPVLDAIGTLLRGERARAVSFVFRTHAPTWCLHFPAAFDTAEVSLRMAASGANKARMLRELGDALRALATEFPLVLLLEDLHWSDASTVDMLRYLGPIAAKQRLLIIGTLRTSELELRNHPLRTCKWEMEAHGACLELALGALDRDAVADYVDARFSDHAFSPDFLAWVERWTQGHPLFLSRMLDWMSDREDLTPASGRWRLARPLSEIELQVPKEIRSMVLQQLKAMHAEEVSMLELASVQGEEFFSVVLAHMLQKEPAWNDARLEALAMVRHVIVEAGVYTLPDGSVTTTYRFSHALFQRAIYENIAAGRRAGLHAEVATALRRLFQSNPGPVSGRLAMHLERAGDTVRAIESLLDAVAVALRRQAAADALSLCARAADLCRAIACDSRTPLQARIHERRGDAYLLQYHLEEARAQFVEMLEAARGADLAELQCRALNRLSYVAIFEHRIAEIRDRANEALTVAHVIGDGRQESEALANLAISHSVSGELAEARKLYERAAAIAEPIGHDAAMLVVQTHLGLLHFFHSDYESADRCLHRGRTLALKLEDGFRLPVSLFFHGLALGNLGRITAALAALSQARAIAERNGNMLSLAQSLNGIGWIHRELHDFERALEFDRRSLEVAAANHVVEAEANAWINLVQGYIQAARWDMAADAVRSAERLYGKDPWNRWRFFDVRLEAAKSELALRTGDLPGADAAARRLLSSATRYRVPKYLAIAYGLLGEIAEEGGRPREAAAHIAAATDVLSGRAAPLTSWKLRVAMARIALHNGNADLAAASFAIARDLVELIAGNIDEVPLRETFLAAAPVRQALGGSPDCGPS